MSSEQSKQRQALGRSRGGLTTKLHVACDALGHPVRLRLTPGQAGDAPQAEWLLGGLSPTYVIADTAYDSDRLRAQIAQLGAEAVIPPNPSRSRKPSCSRALYRERNVVERLIGALKRYRRVSTRYDQTARNYLAFVQIASVLRMVA